MATVSDKLTFWVPDLASGEKLPEALFFSVCVGGAILLSFDGPSFDEPSFSVHSGLQISENV